MNDDPSKLIHLRVLTNDRKRDQHRGIQKTVQERRDDERWLKLVSEMEEIRGQLRELSKLTQTLSNLFTAHVRHTSRRRDER